MRIKLIAVNLFVALAAWTTFGQRAMFYGQNTSQGFVRAITIDHTKVPNTDQTNFPVLITGTYSYLATQPNGGNVRNANGYDVGFYSDLALTTKLSWDTALYTAATGKVEYHVLVPTLSHTADTVIYLSYGRSGITTDQSAPATVWSGYKLVSHLANGSNLSATDSSGNSNNGTITAATATAGQIDGGGSFDGTSAKIDYGSLSAADEGVSKITVSMWGNETSPSTTRNLAYKGTSGGSVAYLLEGAQVTGVSGAILFDLPSGGGCSTDNFGETPAKSYFNGVWNHFVGVFDGTLAGNARRVVYINGVAVPFSVNFGTAPATTCVSGGTLNLGAQPGQTRFWDGSLDEHRVFLGAKPADWILTEYNNQSSPATFYSIGGPTPQNNTAYYALGFRNAWLTSTAPYFFNSPDGLTWAAGTGTYAYGVTAGFGNPTVVRSGSDWYAMHETPNLCAGGSACTNVASLGLAVAHSTNGRDWTHTADITGCNGMGGLFTDGDLSVHLICFYNSGTGTAPANVIREIHPTNASYTAWSATTDFTFGVVLTYQPFNPFLTKIGSTYELWAGQFGVSGYQQYSSSTLTGSYSATGVAPFSTAFESMDMLSLGGSTWRAYLSSGSTDGSAISYSTSTDNQATWSALTTTLPSTSAVSVIKLQ